MPDGPPSSVVSPLPFVRVTWPICSRNCPSGENFTTALPRVSSLTQMLPSQSTLMACAGNGRPSPWVHPPWPGTPHACSRLPSGSNSRTAGAGSLPAASIGAMYRGEAVWCTTQT